MLRGQSRDVPSVLVLRHVAARPRDEIVTAEYKFQT